MKCLPLVLYLTLALDSVHSSLPAPVNVSVDSVNFHHVLRWDPGPGTPPGTWYRFFRIRAKKQKCLGNTTRTSVTLNLKSETRYLLAVQASYNQTLSEMSKVSFCPYEETKIGPPQLSMAGCGNCIQINISLPVRKSKSIDIQEFYGAHFRVLWKKGKNAEVHQELQHNKSFTLHNLESGVEYCVQVHIVTTLNKNTEPSAWNCTFTSIVGPSKGPLVLGAVAALLICVVGVLMASMHCLYYTGFLCKLKATLPRALIAVVSQGYTLTPERIIPYQISISSAMSPRRHSSLTTPQPATTGANSEEEDEEEEEEGKDVYMNRNAEISSGGSSCRDSNDVSRNIKAGALGISESLTVEVPDTEFEVAVTHGGLDQDEAKAEGAEVSVMLGGQTGVQRHVIDEEEEEVCDSSGNVNLFSVTLASLAVCEEEVVGGQNTRVSPTDFLQLSNLEPLVPTDSKRTLSHSDSQTDSDDQTTVALMTPTQEHFNATGYEGRHFISEYM